MFEEVLQRYAYADSKKIIERIKNSTGTDDQENRDIINAIVLWKVNRQVDIGSNLFTSIKNLKATCSSFEEAQTEIQAIVAELLQVKGVKIAMASTILKMFYPEVFPIIDQRAYRELIKKEMPTYYGANANEKYVDLYLQYAKACHMYNRTECPHISFEDIDKILYQLDLEKGNKIKY